MVSSDTSCAELAPDFYRCKSRQRPWRVRCALKRQASQARRRQTPGGARRPLQLSAVQPVRTLALVADLRFGAEPPLPTARAAPGHRRRRARAPRGDPRLGLKRTSRNSERPRPSSSNQSPSKRRSGSGRRRIRREGVDCSIKLDTTALQRPATPRQKSASSPGVEPGKDAGRGPKTWDVMQAR